VITTRRVASTALAALVLAVLGCSSTPKPTPAKITLAAAGDVNPDIEGHPAPIVVRIYELKEEGGFNSTDYFRLIDREQEALGSSLIAREEYELQPGETRILELKIPPEAHFLGAAAGFRDLNNSHWKALLPAPRKGFRKRKLAINVARAAVTIVVPK
jgi:type VI secretion system protein VasD